MNFRPRHVSEEDFKVYETRIRDGKQMTKRVRSGVVGTRTRTVPRTGIVPNETGNATRIPRLAGNKVGAPVPIRGEAVESLDCAGRGEAYNREVGRSRQLRSKEIGRSPKAGSNPASSPYKPYASKWELQYSKVLEVEKRVGAIKDWRYGGISLTLSKGQYHRIDFLIWHTNGQIELAQVKGYHKNLRAGIKGLKWAAQLHPWFSWTIKRWTGTCWDGDFVEI